VTEKQEKTLSKLAQDYATAINYLEKLEVLAGRITISIGPSDLWPVNGMIQEYLKRYLSEAVEATKTELQKNTLEARRALGEIEARQSRSKLHAVDE
jgi:hypothetical protein